MFQVSGLKFQVSSFKFQVSGFKFQVSGFRFKVVETIKKKKINKKKNVPLGTKCWQKKRLILKSNPIGMTHFKITDFNPLINVANYLLKHHK